MPGLILTSAPQCCARTAGRRADDPDSRACSSRLGGQPRRSHGEPPYVVAGCPFPVPPSGTKPQPCVTRAWVSGSARVTSVGMPLLLQAPPGTRPGRCCQSVEQIPQGARRHQLDAAAGERDVSG